MEVFPAPALAGIDTAYCVRLGGPDYNPARRKTFDISYWTDVVNVVGVFGSQLGVSDVPEWCEEQPFQERPKKSD